MHTTNAMCAFNIDLVFVQLAYACHISGTNIHIRSYYRD